MKKLKVLLILSSVALYALAGCGKKPAPGSSTPTPATSIPGGKDVVTPVNVDKVKANLNNLKTVTLTESISVDEIEKHSLGEGLPEVDVFTTGYITMELKIGENDNLEGTSSSGSLEGYANLSKLAEKIGISRETLVKRLPDVQYLDLENDRAITGDSNGESHYYEWFSAQDQQRIKYNVEDDKCGYTLDSNSESETLSTIRDVVTQVIDNGTFDKKTSTFTVDSARIRELGEENLENISLFVQDNYPKRLRAKTSEYDILISLTDYNKTTVTIPTGLTPAKCDHDATIRYDEMKDGHRLYCTKCDKYLAAKENHDILEANNHKYCKKCQTVLGLKSAETSLRTIDVEGQAAYFIYIQKVEDNAFKRYYTSENSFYSKSGSKTLINTSDLLIVYWPNEKALLVRKQYAPNDNTFTTMNSVETLTYSCYKFVKNTYEAFTGIKVSDYPALNDGTFTKETYALIKKDHAPTVQFEAYYMNIYHETTTSKDEEIDSCLKKTTTTCSTCNVEISTYTSSNHEFNENVIKTQIDDCHYTLTKECNKCHRKVDVDSYGKVTNHKNATYRLIDPEEATYIKLKYNVNYSTSYTYVEVKCNTCKETSLYEIEKNNIYQAHLKDKPIRAYYVYTLKDGNVTKKYSTYVTVPHRPDKYGICEFCGEGSVVFTVTEGVKVLVSYSMSSDKETLNNIFVSEYGFKYDHNVFENLEGNKRKSTYYADQEGTQVICSFITTNMYGEYLEILDNTGKTIYKAEKGQPLPEIN